MLFFVSGGTDGFLSVWNMFTGVMKHAIDMPKPSQMVKAEKPRVGRISIR
jgi:hypothetical protein